MSTGLQSLGVRSSQDRRMNFTNRIRRHVLGVLVAACCVAATNGCVVMQPDDDDGGTVNTSTSGAATKCSHWLGGAWGTCLQSPAARCCKPL